MGYRESFEVGGASAIQVLMIEDNPGDSYLVKKLLNKCKLVEFDFSHMDTLRKSKEYLLGGNQPGVILLDLNLPDSSGSDTFIELKNINADIPIVVLTGIDDRELSRSLLSEGAYGFLSKGDMTEGVLFNTIYSCIQRRETEWQLREMKEDAEKSNDEKTQFLSDMSHELRTPLSAIIGFSDIASNLELSREKAVSLSKKASKSAKYLLRLVSDLFDISKVQSGQLNVSKTSFQLFRFLDDFVECSLIQASIKRLKIQCRSTTLIPEVITSDEARLRQILTNLINNSIRYSNGGTIEINIDLQGKLLRFDVKDEGVGISPKNVDQLFQRYSRFGKANRDGTGLGLAISKGLAKLLGGDLHLVNTSNNGSTFQLIIEPGDFGDSELREYKFGNHEEKNNEDIALASSNQLSGVSVLLVEDSNDIKEITQYFLLHNGAKSVDCAETASEAKVKALSGSHHIVLMDVSLPDTDGLTLTKSLRQAGFRKPIIALTAHSLLEFREKCLKAGCDEYMPKPVNYFALNTKILDLIQKYETNLGIEKSNSVELIHSIYSMDKAVLEMMPFFLGHLREFTANLENRISKNNWKDIGKIAHQLKGSAGCYGFPRLAAMASRLEEVASSPSLPVEVKSIAEEIFKLAQGIENGIKNSYLQ